VQKKAQVVELEQDVTNYDVIKRYLTIYLATHAIPSYKRTRVEAYVRAMGCMTYEEIKNSESVMECFMRFQEVIGDYGIVGSMPGGEMDQGERIFTKMPMVGRPHTGQLGGGDSQVIGAGGSQVMQPEQNSDM